MITVIIIMFCFHSFIMKERLWFCMLGLCIWNYVLFVFFFSIYFWFLKALFFALLLRNFNQSLLIIL
jgi:hypothetical protein